MYRLCGGTKLVRSKVYSTAVSELSQDPNLDLARLAYVPDVGAADMQRA